MSASNTWVFSPSLPHNYGNCTLRDLLTSRSFIRAAAVSVQISATSGNYLSHVFQLPKNSTPQRGPCTWPCLSFQPQRHRTSSYNIIHEDSPQWSLSCPWILHFKHQTSLCTSNWAALSFFRLWNSRQRFCNSVWIYWTPKVAPWIGVSCNIITISRAFALVPIFCCDKETLRWGKSEATNHSWCCPSIRFMLASQILHFNLWSSSQGVSPSFIMISLNPTIDCASDLGILNSLFNVV